MTVKSQIKPQPGFQILQSIQKSCVLAVEEIIHQLTHLQDQRRFRAAFR